MKVNQIKIEPRLSVDLQVPQISAELQALG
jgi:hypothetical protein